MAIKKRTSAQGYPRIANEHDKFNGFFDSGKIKGHKKNIDTDELKKIIIRAISSANKKSGRAILALPEKLSKKEYVELCKAKGRELFDYFQKYCGDPASTAHECLNRHYTQIAREQFRNRTLQKERMNAGWRYQYIARDAAILSERFISVSDIGANEADFNAKVEIKNTKEALNIYVSVKNRTNTMGGQDWPKAIRALEDVAKNDKNRNGSYLCIFGIAMEKGLRTIKNEAKTKTPYSMNTEVWLSDYFWPFFTNKTYEEIIKAVLGVLLDIGQESGLDIEIPEELIESFGAACKAKGLLDNKGNFNDAYRLVELFCGTL